MQCPFKIVVDSREQRPWAFEGITQRIKGVDVTVAIETAVEGLDAGDYSIAGFENRIAIERKSISDLVSTIFHERERFERELTRLRTYEYSAIIVEGTWSQMIKYCRKDTGGNPKSLQASIIAFDSRFNTKWWWMPDRRLAALQCFRILERFYKDDLRRIQS